MIRTVVIACLAAATLIAGAVLFFAPSSEVKANTPSASAKAEGLDTQQAKDDCTLHAWPYYPGECIRDYRRSTGKAHDVRVVFTGAARAPK
jgi:hypothetical protein